mmetsp:Transcript_2912/g.4943  ORF Transcript_2912/g.4943 Transcript_2912/m.4943 type:complete len:330 (-) Transcript_2912:1843-2832(-)
MHIAGSSFRRRIRATGCTLWQSFNVRTKAIASRMQTEFHRFGLDRAAHTVHEGHFQHCVDCLSGPNTAGCANATGARGGIQWHKGKWKTDIQFKVLACQAFVQFALMHGDATNFEAYVESAFHARREPRRCPGPVVVPHALKTSLLEGGNLDHQLLLGALGKRPVSRGSACGNGRERGACYGCLAANSHSSLQKELGGANFSLVDGSARTKDHLPAIDERVFWLAVDHTTHFRMRFQLTGVFFGEDRAKRQATGLGKTVFIVDAEAHFSSFTCNSWLTWLTRGLFAGFPVFSVLTLATLSTKQGYECIGHLWHGFIPRSCRPAFSRHAR